MYIYFPVLLTTLFQIYSRVCLFVIFFFFLSFLSDYVLLYFICYLKGLPHDYVCFPEFICFFILQCLQIDIYKYSSSSYVSTLQHPSHHHKIPFFFWYQTPSSNSICLILLIIIFSAYSYYESFFSYLGCSMTATLLYYFHVDILWKFLQLCLV